MNPRNYSRIAFCHQSLAAVVALCLLACTAISQAQITTVVSFNGNDGAKPFGDVTLIGSTLYDTTAYGGANNTGTVFSVVVAPPTPVVLSGTPAPAGGNYSDFGYDSPVLNPSGQVAFTANLTGGSSTQGIFAGAPGALQPVALQGTASPVGGIYNSDPQYDPNTFHSLVLNASGQVAFYAHLNGSAFGLPQDAIFVGAPGAVQAVAVDGTAAPGGYYVSTYEGLANANVRLNGSGQVAFGAALGTGYIGGGIFVGAPGSVQAVVQVGPIDQSNNFRGPYALNGSGQVAFLLATSGSNGYGVYVGAPGSIQAVALQGGAAPAGGNYDFSYQDDPVLNASGQVAFTASLTGGPSAQGIFVGVPGSIRTMALQGCAAPAGGTYSYLHAPVLNGAGQVAFFATLTGGSSTEGIFVGAPGAIQAVALQGSAAPCGGQFDLHSNLDYQLNGFGQVAFTADVALTNGPIIDGLFAGTAGSLETILLVGDVINVASGSRSVERTVSSISFSSNVSGGQDGTGMTFNDSGLLVYELGFTDGSSGIFTSQITQVPEPGTLALLGFVGLAGAWRRRRTTRAVLHPGLKPLVTKLGASSRAFPRRLGEDDDGSASDA